MMEDLVIALLIICMIAVPFLIIAGIAELVIYPFLDRRAEERKEARRMSDACTTGGRCIDTRRTVAICAVCGDPICDDDIYYVLDDKPICAACTTEYINKNVWGA